MYLPLQSKFGRWWSLIGLRKPNHALSRQSAQRPYYNKFALTRCRKTLPHFWCTIPCNGQNHFGKTSGLLRETKCILSWTHLATYGGIWSIFSKYILRSHNYNMEWSSYSEAVAQVVAYQRPLLPPPKVFFSYIVQVANFSRNSVTQHNIKFFNDTV